MFCVDKGKIDMICRKLGQLFFLWVGKNSGVLSLLEEPAFLLSFTSLVCFPKIFNQELFGNVAEEKEVKGIVSKIMEARKNKSYDSYEILGKFIGRSQVTKLILPLKEVRKVSQSLSNCEHSQFCKAILEPLGGYFEITYGIFLWLPIFLWESSETLLLMSGAGSGILGSF